MEHAVSTARNGASGIKDGVAMVNSAGVTFQKIVADILELSERIREISAAIDQVKAGSHNLATAIHEVDKVSKKSAAEIEMVSAATEEQSASMQEIASASQGLARLAGTLQEAVAKFRV